jgi:hypothetical protein
MGSLVGMKTCAFLVRACRFFPGKFLNYFASGDLITNYFLCGAALFRQPPGQQTFFRILPELFPDFLKISNGKFFGFFYVHTKNFGCKRAGRDRSCGILSRSLRSHWGVCGKPGGQGTGQEKINCTS